MKTRNLFLTLCAALAFSFAGAQGLENVVVETYYVSDANDATDTDGGNLPEGSTTYRIYLDLAAGYKLETIYGSPDHELRIETTTLFFNNEDRGELTGNLIGDNRLDENTVALDSYLTFGGASESHFGVLKTEDNDGSIVGGVNNDGGSEGVEGGLLTNDDPDAGIPLTTADGLIAGTPPSITLIAENSSVFDIFGTENDGPVFTTSNGAWAVLGGAEGQTDDNLILVAQITTDGELSFSLNVRVSQTDGSGEPIDYVASAPQGDEVLFPSLNFPLADIEGCTSPSACNFNPDATEDDGSCVFADDVCEFCNEDGTVGETIVDGGSLTYEDGSESQTQCAGDDIDYNVSLNGNEGPASAYVITTSVDDGLIVLGVQESNIFNFAGASPDTCLIWNLSYDPENSNAADVVVGETSALDLTGCYALSNSIEIIREDCSVILGCTDMIACNFNPDATEEDDSCVFADDACEFCNEDGTVGETLVDGGSLTYEDGSESQTQCAGDDVDYTVSLVGNEGPASAYVITTSVDDGLIVLGVQESNIFNFAGASPDTCLIWNLSYDPESSNVSAVVVGETSALDLTGCYDLSNSIEIIREDCSDDCQAPFPSINEESLAATYNGTTIVLSWDPIPGAIACQIQGREAGTGGSAVLKTLIEGEELGSYTIAPFRLDPATTYEWRVRCGCSVDPLVVSEWSAINTFTTPAGAEISSSPNPTEGVSFVNFTVESDGMVTLEVFDLSGRSVASIFSGQALSNNNYRFEFDGSGLPNGIYLYRLFTEREVINEKFMIAR